MPFALIAAGIVFFVTAMRGTTDDLAALIKKDFTGPGNFLVWILVFGAVGATGYIKPFRPIANAFLVLLVIVFILAANKGGKDFVSSLVSQITKTNVTLGAT